MAIAANSWGVTPGSRLIYIAYCNIGKVWRIIRLVKEKEKNEKIAAYVIGHITVKLFFNT
jgi:hypothetical protein